MKASILCLLVLPGAIGASNAVAVSHGSVGYGHGIQVPCNQPIPCSGLLLYNFDGTAENGYCWQYGGIASPYFGAFAECFNYAGTVCGIELLLTGLGYPGGPMDAYVWADDGGKPGSVVAMASDLTPPSVATWPCFGCFEIPIGPAVVDGAFWVGYWANFSAQSCGYYVTADLDGIGGCPLTNIAPGIGFPTGWQNVSAVWGPTQSIGIGAWCGGPTGACCVYDSCAVRPQSYCTDHGGHYLGDGRSCDPDPCPTSSSAGGAFEDLSLKNITAVPNPSTGEVLMSYRVPKTAVVTLVIFRPSGAVVRRIAEGPRVAGVQTTRWDGRNDRGEELPSGVYLTRIETPSGVITGKVVLTR